MENNKIEEMAMDTVNHPTHGKLSWENNGGVHQIKKGDTVVFSGNHEEASTKWKAIKNSISEGTEFIFNAISEEYKLDGKTDGNVIDSETNEPIATYKKQYGKTYGVTWHPTFLKIHPGIANSLEARDLSATSCNSKEAIIGHVGRIHSKLAQNGFGDLIPAIANKENSEIVHLHPETNEIIATSKPVEYYNNRSFSLHPNFVAKHNIPDSVKSAYEAKLNKSETHIGRNEELSAMLADVGKKKIATGLHTLGNASVRVYHTDATPEEASSAHENQLKNNPENELKDLNITRLSPTHFIGSNKNYMIHSIVHGNQIHQVTTNLTEYSSKKTPLSLNF